MTTIRPGAIAAALAAALTVGLALPAAAQPAKPPAKAAAKPAAKPAAKAPAKKPARSAARKPAPKTPPPLADASPEQMEAAQRAYLGDFDCEFKQTVVVGAFPDKAGYLQIKHGGKSWVTKPIVSSTGAIRLEDVKEEVLMVQIAQKSMLLNTRSGQRMVDDCMNPAQAAARAAAAGTPQQSNLGIDPNLPTAPAPAAASAPR